MPNLDQPLLEVIIKDKTPNITTEDKSRAEGMLEILSKSSPDVLAIVAAYLDNIQSNPIPTLPDDTVRPAKGDNPSPAEGLRKFVEVGNV